MQRYHEEIEEMCIIISNKSLGNSSVKLSCHWADMFFTLRLIYYLIPLILILIPFLLLAVSVSVCEIGSELCGKVAANKQDQGSIPE